MESPINTSQQESAMEDARRFCAYQVNARRVANERNNVKFRGGNETISKDEKIINTKQIRRDLTNRQQTKTQKQSSFLIKAQRSSSQTVHNDNKKVQRALSQTVHKDSKKVQTVADLEKGLTEGANVGEKVHNPKTNITNIPSDVEVVQASQACRFCDWQAVNNVVFEEEEENLVEEEYVMPERVASLEQMMPSAESLRQANGPLFSSLLTSFKSQVALWISSAVIKPLAHMYKAGTDALAGLLLI